jgi:hypothetical protein
MDWRLKGLVQKALGYVPAGEALHYRLQRRFGTFRDMAGEFDVKVSDWRLMVGHLAAAGFRLTGARLLEIGSGWYPTFPFACYLGGARQVITVDLTRHLKGELARTCAELLGNHLELIASACEVPIDEVRARHRALLQRLDGRMDLAAASEGVVDYRAPADARATGLPDQSIDCVFSNSVLEHVREDAIDAMYLEARRILRPEGLMFHSVNCGDHYAYIDSSISQLNYLRYSEGAWRLWQNEFLYQNRLRAREFVQRAERAGFTITLNTANASDARLQELRAVPVHTQFADIPPEQLCITSVDFIARKTPPAG